MLTPGPRLGEVLVCLAAGGGGVAGGVLCFGQHAPRRGTVSLRQRQFRSRQAADSDATLMGRGLAGSPAGGLSLSLRCAYQSECERREGDRVTGRHWRGLMPFL